MKKIFAITFLAAFVVSCGSDENDNDNNPTVERIADDYHPNTVGSTWNYSSAFFDFVQSIPNKTKSIDGKVYFAVKVQIPGLTTFTTYMRKSGNIYINRELYNGQYDDGEYIFLKDDVVGTTWTEISYEEYDDEIVEIEDVLEVIEVDGTYSVGDEEFDNVIVVQVLSYEDGSEEPYVLFYYYAKGVGLIKIEDNNELASTELTEYSIEN